MNCSKRARGRNSGGLELPVDDVVEGVGVVRAEPGCEAELILEGVVEPEASGCAAEEEVVFREDAPDFAGVGVGRACGWGYAERFERDALGVEHAEDVVVRLDEQSGGVGESFVAREPAGIGMAVRREDGEVAYGLIQLRCYGAGGRLGWEKPVLVQHSLGIPLEKQ